MYQVRCDMCWDREINNCMFIIIMVMIISGLFFTVILFDLVRSSRVFEIKFDNMTFYFKN